MDKRIHIALVTTWFPPRQGVAVHRMTALSRYFDPAVFRVSVFTIREGNSGPFEEWEGLPVHRLKNNSFLPSLQNDPGDSRIMHTLKVIWNMAAAYLRPFEYACWKKRTVRKLHAVHSEIPFDVVISSYSPVESHLAAAEFLKSNRKIVWVADMRDEMSANKEITARKRAVLIKAEKIINGRANLLTAVSKPILEDFKRLLPGIKHFAEIRNGFDHHTADIERNHNKVFTISYAGTFYGQIKPHTFFRGLQRFLDKKKVNVRIRFIGTHHNFDIPPGIKPFCTFIPALSNEEAVKIIAASDANLLILPQTGRKGVYSGKIFDYISVRKPVIAVVDPSDVAAELIREYEAGYVAGFDDIPAIEQAIESAYALWEKRAFLPVDANKVKELHRKYQVRKLGELILNLSGKK